MAEKCFQCRGNVARAATTPPKCSRCGGALTARELIDSAKGDLASAADMLKDARQADWSGADLDHAVETLAHALKPLCDAVESLTAAVDRVESIALSAARDISVHLNGGE